MHTKALPSVALLGFLWGTNLVIMRVGVGQFDPMVFVGIRLLLSSLAFIVVYTFSGRRLVPTPEAAYASTAAVARLPATIPIVRTALASPSSAGASSSRMRM